jgi:hypothetical protein
MPRARCVCALSTYLQGGRQDRKGRRTTLSARYNFRYATKQLRILGGTGNFAREHSMLTQQYLSSM